MRRRAPRANGAPPPQAFEHFGVNPSDAPRVLIEDRKAQLRFLMDGAVSKAAVEKFVADYKAGNLEPFLKSEPEPADNTAPVKVVVADSFQKWTTGGKWLFLEAYAPWCGHCKNLAPVWEDLGKAFAGESDKLVIAKVDATANDLPKSLGVQGFPTLMLFKGDGSPPERYAQGERDYAALSKWLTDKTGAKPAADFVPTSPKAPSKGATAGKWVPRAARARPALRRRAAVRARRWGALRGPEHAGSERVCSEHLQEMS